MSKFVLHFREFCYILFSSDDLYEEQAMAQEYTLQQVSDFLEKNRNSQQLEQFLPVIRRALSLYSSQKQYSNSDYQHWLKIANLAAKKYTSEALKQGQKVIEQIKNEATGRMSMETAKKKNTAADLSALSALLQQKERTENNDARTEIPNFVFSLEDKHARPQNTIKEEQISAPAAETLKKLPRLNIKAINDEATPYFEKSQRRQGFQKLHEAAEKYISQNNITNENITTLQSTELEFLYRNLYFSKHPQSGLVLKLIEAEMLGRILNAQEIIQAKTFLNPKEQQALSRFVRYYLSQLNKKEILSDVEKDDQTYYPGFLDSIEKYKNPPQEKGKQHPQQTSPSIEYTVHQASAKEVSQKELPPADEEIVDEKVTETAVPEEQPGSDVTEIEVASETTTETKKEKEQVSANEPVNADLAAKFEESCNKRKIRFDKQEKENQIEYALYAPRAADDAEPTGKLTIADAHNVTLQSDEFQHFVALAQAAKASGAPSLQIGELSKDETEAKKFVAMLVLAGYVAKIKVKHHFKLEELAEVNPEIKKMQEIQRLERETQLAFEAMKKASGEQKDAARHIYHQKLIDKTQYYIQNGGIYDTSTPEKRREKIAQQMQRNIEHPRGNHQKTESQAILSAIGAAKGR